MNSIKDVGFSHAIIANKAIDLWSEFQFSMIVVFKIRKGKSFKVHGCVVRGSRVHGFNKLKVDNSYRIYNYKLITKLKKRIGHQIIQFIALIIKFIFQ